MQQFIDKCRQEINRSHERENVFAQTTYTRIELLMRELAEFRAAEERVRARCEQDIKQAESDAAAITMIADAAE